MAHPVASISASPAGGQVEVQSSPDTDAPLQQPENTRTIHYYYI